MVERATPFPRRKAIPQSVRFEVFKRDAFTCQYCGGKSPDVILVVDHIKPVATGGVNDIVNLITSCRDCNSGKGAVELDDDSMLAKQRKQLEDLNERRNQLEMMVKWREGLNNLEDMSIEAIQDELGRCSGFTANEKGLRTIKRLLRKYPLDEILTTIPTSYSQYFDPNLSTEWKRDASWARALRMIERIIVAQRADLTNPGYSRLFYIRGILRNRFPGEFDEHECLSLLREAADLDASIEALEDRAKTVSSWERFEELIWEFLNRQKLKAAQDDPDK
jgi:hypothetical protein